MIETCACVHLHANTVMNFKDLFTSLADDAAVGNRTELAWVAVRFPTIANACKYLCSSCVACEFTVRPV